MADRSPEVPRRIRLVVVVLVSALFLAAIMNLILVAERAPLVEPEGHPPRDWRTGSGSGTVEGRETWTVTVFTQERDVVELDVDLPYVVSVTHVAGRGDLLSRVAYLMEGTEVATENAAFPAHPKDNETQGVSRTSSTRGAFGFGDDPVRIDVPEGLEQFEFSVVWDWTYAGSADADVSFRIQTGDFHVEGLDVGGVPFCNGIQCSRLAVVFTLVGQVLAFVWLGRSGEGDSVTPGMKRQSHVEKEVAAFDVDEPDALPVRKKDAPPRPRRGRSKPR